jgi:hypothetical protein
LIFWVRKLLFEGMPELVTIGVTIIIFIAINVLLALIMIIKGIRTKYYTMALIGAIFFAGISSWGGVFYNFLYVVITDEFPSWIWGAWFTIQGGALFVFHFIWIVGVSKLADIKKKTRIVVLIFVGLATAILEVIYWLILTTDPYIFGEPLFFGSPSPPYPPPGFPFLIDYSWVGYFFLTVSLGFFTPAILWIVIESWKSSDRRIRLKAKFLLIYAILITLGSLSEIYDPLDNLFEKVYDFAPLDAAVAANYINKIGLTIGVFCGYIGFVLPKPIEKIFIRS